MKNHPNNNNTHHHVIINSSDQITNPQNQQTTKVPTPKQTNNHNDVFYAQDIRNNQLFTEHYHYPKTKTHVEKQYSYNEAKLQLTIIQHNHTLNMKTLIDKPNTKKTIPLTNTPRHDLIKPTKTIKLHYQTKEPNLYEVEFYKNKENHDETSPPNKITYHVNNTLKSVKYFYHKKYLHHDLKPALTEYYNNGKRKRIAYYQNNHKKRLNKKLPAEIKHYKTGQLKEITYYKNNERHSPVNYPSIITYHKNGMIEKVYYFRHGSLHSTTHAAYTQYNEQGQITQQYYYLWGSRFNKDSWFKHESVQKTLRETKNKNSITTNISF